MSKVFRRTWERQRYGRAGAVSSPLSARTGTDGVISGAAFATPVKIFTSATAAFVASDVGRKIRLSGTPSNRYNGMYVIDSVNSGTSVNLRFNHNVGGTPTSDARFFENGTGITWKICESCTFTCDSAGDMEDFYPGAYMFVDSTNDANKGLWLISHRVDSQTCVLSKSYVYWMTDNNPYTEYTIEGTQDFQAQSGLRWYVIDRQPMSLPDYWELFHQFLVDTGWAVWQQRGHSTTLQTYRDVVYKSTGETDALIPGGKTMFYRWTLNGVRSGAQATSALQVMGAIYQHWDPTLTATAPGQGSGGCRASSNANNSICAQGGGVAFSSFNSAAWGSAPFRVSSDTSWVERGRADIPDAATFFDYSFFGDRDEIQVSVHMIGLGGATTSYARSQFGHLKVMGSNPNIVTAINNITSGANKDVNVGTVDMTALTPPYAVGDNITLIGRKTASPAEYVETTTIVSFNNTDPNNRLVRVAAVSMAFGNGPDTLKLQVGEDPFPVAIMEGNSTTFTAPYLQNLAKLANTTFRLGSQGRDYDATNYGSTSTGFEIYGAGFSEVDPNRKTGKYGLLAVGVRNTTNGEFRGRWRYYWDAPDYKWPIGAKLIVGGTDAYVVTTPNAVGSTNAVGPMTKAMAGIYT